MNANQAAAFVSAQTALLNARIAGMQAENRQCEFDGLNLRYVEEDFSKVENDFTHVLGENAIMQLYREV